MAVVFVNGAVDISIDVLSRLPMGDNLTPVAEDQIADVMDDLIAELREYLIDNWPVATGRSQQLWSFQWDSPWWIIRNPVEYAEFVHPKDDDTPSWEGVEAESERLLASAMPRLEAIASQSAVTTLERAVTLQQRFAARLVKVATAGLMASVFAASVQAFRETPSRRREAIARERQQARARDRSRNRAR